MDGMEAKRANGRASSAAMVEQTRTKCGETLSLSFSVPYSASNATTARSNSHLRRQRTATEAASRRNEVDGGSGEDVEAPMEGEVDEEEGDVEVGVEGEPSE